MTDDIVTRLRELSCSEGEIEPCGICLPCSASDEIERLRKENAELLAELQEVHEEHRW